ncbi:MAG: hypothetical protein KC994_01835 [Candidatus Omnitrophica bacterium]|nr:hypothetical protein [Candidatus Omnitrophota bacterium]
MKFFWITLNVFLIIGLGAGGFLLFRGYQSFSANNPGLAPPPQVVDLRQNPVHLESSIRLVMQSASLLEGEAILAPAGEPARFTLRPEIALPSETDDFVHSYVSTHPNLEDEIQVAWQSDSGGELKSFGEGRYEFIPDATGGPVILRFRGVLDRGGLDNHPFTLSGETAIKFLFPTPIDQVPQQALEDIGKFPVVGSKSILAPYRDYYRPPTHLYRVDEENQNWRISPNFELGDFDLHFDYTTPDAPRRNQLPQYIALDPKLVLKLEQILEGIREQGFEAPTLSILAGFRSPAYNHWKIEQPGQGGAYTSNYSRHIYGCAADFYVDIDGDGKMDDMNGDGKIDMEDAAWIRDNVVDAVDCQAVERMPDLKGACGIYPEHDIPNGPVQTPNLHVDIRGWEGGPDLSRWDIDSNNKRRTLWSHWDKHPCPEEAPIDLATQ